MQTASKTYEKNGRRYRYRYRAVTSGGVGVHSKDYVVLSSAHKCIEKIKSTWPDAEIQRVRELLVGNVSRPPADEVVWARQYELWSDGKWIPEHKVPDRDERGRD